MFLKFFKGSGTCTSFKVIIHSTVNKYVPILTLSCKELDIL